MNSALYSRPANDAEAIHGAVPERVFEPRTVDELGEVLRSTQSERLAVAPIGSGTQLSYGNRLERYDAAIVTRALNRIVEYAPEDQVVTAEAGMTLGELQAALAEHGQRLAVDSPGGAARTIGGLIATNDFGPRRARYGGLRDLLIGIEMVRADGVTVHAGGKVVKNVAGFDLCKIAVGSLGTLGVITKATFRVHPLPAAQRAVAADFESVDGAFAFLAALRAAQLEPAAVWCPPVRRKTQVCAVFEGFESGVASQIERAMVLAKECAAVNGVDFAPSAHNESASSGVVWRCECAPADLPAILNRSGPGWSWPIAYPELGVTLFSEVEPLESPQADRDDAVESVGNADVTVETLLASRAVLESLGGRLVVLGDTTSRVIDMIDAWGTPPPSFPLMQAMKARFDPERRLNPGRFVGGI